MAYAGLLVTLLGFVLAVLSLGITQSVGARLGIVVAGLALSLFGIIGLLNPAYLKNAIWRRE
jgi:hypothetical protein